MGGNEDFTCLLGHIGALCDVCDYYREKWDANYIEYSLKEC